MNKNIALVFALLLVVGAGLVFYSTRTTPPVVAMPTQVGTSTATAISYKNTQYGFTFALPATWLGYSIVETTWTGTSPTSVATASGPKILVRHPQWTAEAPYEDLPILVFTLAEWDSYTAEHFSISAAPIQASELARNNKYVFALPPRWDFDYSLGYLEAQTIMTGKPLQTFDVAGAGMPQAKLNINVVCEKALEYMRFADTKSADAFEVDCIDGKHPEVIEKYKADLNLGAGVAI